MRTKESIEASQSEKTPNKNSDIKPKIKEVWPLGKNPRSLANLCAPWTPESAPRNGGRPKKDMSQEIAKQVFENNPELIYKAFSAQLAKGGAFAFQVLSDRAYGKLKETREIGNEYNDIPDDQVQAEIDKLMARIGLARAADDAAEAGVSTARAAKANGKAQDSVVLPGNGSVKA